jgi:hypothetical protein
VRALIVVLLVLVALLVVADRVAVAVAEDQVADRIAGRADLPGSPEVDIAGFPFLTQLAAGDYDEITVRASNVPVGGARVLRLSDFTVVLHSLTVSRSFHRFHAGTADATARASYADLSRALGVPITYAGDGRVRARGSVSVAGRQFGGSITARPQLRNASLGFGALAGEGQLGRAAAQALGKIFDVAIPLADLPFRIQVQRLDATREGLVLQLHGKDLSYSR